MEVELTIYSQSNRVCVLCNSVTTTSNCSCTSVRPAIIKSCVCRQLVSTLPFIRISRGLAENRENRINLKLDSRLIEEKACEVYSSDLEVTAWDIPKPERARCAKGIIACFRPGACGDVCLWLYGTSKPNSRANFVVAVGVTSIGYNRWKRGTG